MTSSSKILSQTAIDTYTTAASILFSIFLSPNESKANRLMSENEKKNPIKRNSYVGNRKILYLSALGTNNNLN